jgi:transposase
MGYPMTHRTNTIKTAAQILITRFCSHYLDMRKQKGYNTSMKISKEQFAVIAPLLPKQRGNVKIDNLTFVRAILYVTSNGCKWRDLPKEYGNWHTIYVRMLRWSEGGVLQRLFEALQEAGIIKINVEVIHIDSTSVRVHQDATGAPKKRALKASGDPGEATPRKFTWSPHLTERLFASRFQQEISTTRPAGRN